MTHFSVGDRVIIRYGKLQGRKAIVLKRQEAEVYVVRAEDGSVGYYTGKGLEGEKGPKQAVCGDR